MRPPVRVISMIGTALILAVNLALGAVMLGGDPMVTLFLLVVLLPLDAFWLWTTRRRRTMNITIDPDLLDVQLTRLGARYRIPLCDVEAARVLDVRARRRRLRLELPDDVIEIGEGFDARELVWLASVVRSSASAARKRPAKRQGMPDEVPAQLAALQSTKPPA